MKTLHLKTEKTHRFAASLSEQMPWFNPTFVQVGFVADKAAIWRVLLCILSLAFSASFHQCPRRT